MQTPSKVLAAALSGFGIASPTKADLKMRHMPSNLSKIMLRVEKARKYTSTEKCITPELQLIIDPAELVDEAKSCLRHPDPNVGKLEARKQAAAEATGVEAASARNYKFDDPYESQKLWIPSCLLNMATPHLVMAWEQREEDKLKKKQTKQTKSSPKRKQPTKVRDSPNSVQTSISLSSKPVTATAHKGKGKADDSASDDEDLFAPSPLDNQKPRAPTLHLAPVAPQSRSLSRTSSATSSDISTSDKSHHRARSRSRYSSDSDIEFVSSQPLGKSPKKSPRRTSATHTARESQSHSKVIVDAPRPKQAPKAKAYKYEELSDTSSDDDAKGIALPAVSRPPVTLAQFSPKREQLAHPTALATTKSAVPREVIDLCSSP